jgi:hypothetical protein
MTIISAHQRALSYQPVFWSGTEILTTMNKAVAAVTLGPMVHRNVYGRSRVTGFDSFP